LIIVSFGDLHKQINNQDKETHMKKNIIYLLSLALFVFFTCSSAMAKDVMTLAVHDYAPYYNNEGKGMMIDLYQAICDDAGIDVTFKVLPVKRAIEYLFQDKVDAFSPGHIFMTPEQVKQVSLVKTFSVVGIFMYYDPGKKKTVVYNSIADLKGKKLAVVVNSPWIPAYTAAGVAFEEIQTPELLVKMVRAGRVDFIETTLLAGMSLTNNLFKTEMQGFDFVINQAIECSVAFHTSNPKSMALMAKFNASFEKIKKNGTYIRIFESYWGKNNIQKETLPADLAAFGVQKASLEAFSKYKRNAWDKIEESK